MKFLITLILTLLLMPLPKVFAANSDSQNIKDQVLALQKVALSSTEIDLQGSSAYEMIQSLSNQMIGDNGISITLNTIPDAMDELDIGTTTNQAALDLVLGAMDQMDYTQNPFSKEQREEVKRIFSELAKTNAIYGWNPFGSASCGGTFSTAIIIDPVTKKAYEFVFLSMSEC